MSTSVPLSGFLNLSAVSWQAQGLWPCFVPLPSLGSSLQSFSLTRIACLSRGPLSRSPAPLQLSTGELKRAVLRRSPSVSPTSTLSRGCLDSPRTMDFLSTDRGPFSGRPGLRSAGLASPRQLHLLRSFHPPVRPSLQLQVTPPLSVVALLVFFPFGAFSFHTSDPRPVQPRGLNTLLRPWTPVRYSEDRDPLSQVRSFKARVPKKISSTGSNPLEGLVRTVSRRRLLLSWSWVSRRAWIPDLQSFEVCGKRRFSWESACSLEVWCLLTSLVTSRSFPVLASPEGFTERLGSRLRSPARSLDLRTPLLTGHVAVVSA
jgi:hypothetical protein